MRILWFLLLCLYGSVAWATPSTLVYIPSTDIQPSGVWHLGMDSYGFIGGDMVGAFSDLGVTYGLSPHIEVGMDLISGADSPLWLNGKVQILSSAQSPVALAAGVYNWNTSDITGQNVLYLVGSSTFAGTRLTYGYYQGDRDVLQPDSAGILLGIDRTINQWWLGADYQSGDNAIGALNTGVGYALTDKVGVILGYDDYNARDAADSLNFQVDINF